MVFNHGRDIVHIWHVHKYGLHLSRNKDDKISNILVHMLLG